MPTNEEQVAQIETALRNRFFTLVPRVEIPERANWTEGDHDTNRLSRALAAYALARISDIDDTSAVGAITDGKDDGGIDALYFDRPRTRLVIVASKFKRGGASPSQAENLKTVNGIRDLLNRRFEKFNAQFQQRLDEIEEALDTPGVILEIALAPLK